MPKLPQSYCFLLFDGFSNMVLASAIEPLRAARDLSGDRDLFNWRLATLDGRPARSSSGLSITADAALPDVQTAEALIIISSYGTRRFADPTVRRYLRRAARRFAWLGGVDMGAWLLADAGILNNRRATIHWQELDALAEEFSAIEVISEPFVIDRGRMTAGGASTVTALAMRLIRERAGHALAHDVSNLFVYDAERAHDHRLLDKAFGRIRSAPLHVAIKTIRDRVESPLSIVDLALVASVSPRTLHRIFRSELGVSPGHYQLMVRLNVARSLAQETDFRIPEIAARTGFSSSATLARAYAGHFGTSVGAARQHRGA